MKQLLWVWVFLATFFLVSCGHESTVKVFVTGPDASVSTSQPASIDVPPITVNVEVPTTNLMGPPADADVPFNAPQESACEKPGRGVGRGRGHCK
jgi:hypothetical protein